MGRKLTTTESERPQRRSIRVKEYDYASPGAYFVTVCAHNRRCVFIVQDVRDAVQQAWRQIPVHFCNTKVDQFVILPNHIHGIVWILAGHVVGAQHAAPLPGSRAPRVVPGSLGAIVRSFKAAATGHVNSARQTPGTPVWQRNYYERVIRDEDELARIREYIVNNPLQWQFDRENPDRMTNPQYENQWRWLEGDVVGAQSATGGRPALPTGRQNMHD